MKIVEITGIIEENGALEIPDTIIKDMGLNPNDTVYLAYITRDEQTNEFKEFLLSPECFSSLSEVSFDGTINIPVSLLDEAGIQQDSDVIIECSDGRITITEANLRNEELRQVTSELRNINASLRNE